MEDAKKHVGWDWWGNTDGEYEALAVFTGQLCLDTPSILGVAELNGNDFIVRDFNSCAGQHEMSHLYGCYDHDPGLWTWCVMSYTWGYYVRS